MGRSLGGFQKAMLSRRKVSSLFITCLPFFLLLLPLLLALLLLDY
jgi:hypothetical protein